MTAARKRRIVVWVAVAAALGLVTWLRVLLVDNLHDQGWFAKYVELADRAVAGRMPADRIGDISPAYFWTMLLLRRAGLGVMAIRDLQIVAVSLAALCCGLAAKRLAGWAAGVAAAVLVLGNRAVLVIATELEPESLILLVNALAILLVVKWSHRPALPDEQQPPRYSMRLALFIGLLLGVSAVARPVALLMIVLVALWMLLHSWRNAAAMVAAALVPIAVILAVNASITGHLFIMQPGSQMYDGNNPLATGCAGVLPRIVADLEYTSNEPDYLHVAYRIVAARAAGVPAPDARLSNRFWSAKASSFIRRYPARALELFSWKALLAVHNYDIYDLSTTKLKGVELMRYPAIPFGAAFALAVAALVLHERRRSLLPVLGFALATLAALVLFNVSARQRNALMAPLAVLGGVGAAAILRLGRNRLEHGLLAFGAVAIATVTLGIEGSPTKENNYVWLSSTNSSRMRVAAYRAREAGRNDEAVRLAAMASILDAPRPPLVRIETLRQAALHLAADPSEQRRFDAAVALQKAGAWKESEGVLATLVEYRPLRENRAVSSVSYYRARAAMHLGVPPGLVDELIARAAEEAPGHPDVLALMAIRGDEEAAVSLDAIHDRFTRDLAIARASLDAGDPARARNIVARLQREFPEWTRPAQLMRSDR